MKTDNPSHAEIKKLVSFLHVFNQEGFQPILRWKNSGHHNGEALSEPILEYHEEVLSFFQSASSDHWRDPDYQPEIAWEMLQNDSVVQSATIEQIKTMLTYCSRGERFCSGHWAEMIEKGYIGKLLDRLSQL
jgi:hypothetical protein